MTPEDAARSVAAARASAKTAFKTMMDAATKTANLFTVCADADPANAAKWRDAAQQWQNSATTAMNHWREL